eukprot:556259_1
MVAKQAKHGKYDYGIKLEYEVEEGTRLKFHHLLSLLLYTDYSKLCTAFSSSFRAVTPYEPLSSIKERNSSYWWMSKCLREAVQLFGYDNKYGGVPGPFYSGLGIKLVFPSFELRLCSPTSTSKQIEVATKFAGRNGIVVQLNNNIDEHTHRHLKGFPCYLYSRYKGEDEYLFIGGHYRIKIESVRIIYGKQGKCQNFEEFFGAFNKLNNILNGGYVESKNINKKEKKIISSLLSGKVDKFDEYIKKTIKAFILNKTQIVLNYYVLSAWDMDVELREMIMYGMRRMETSIEDKTNLFRKTLLKRFKNIQTVIIYTTDVWGGDSCPLSFLWLLSEIEKVSFSEIIIKGVCKDKKNPKPSWIYMIWKKTRNSLIQKYKEKNLKILFKNTKNERGCKEDC